MALNVPAPRDPASSVLVEARQDFQGYAAYAASVPRAILRGPWSFPIAVGNPSVTSLVHGTPIGTVAEVSSSAATDQGVEFGGLLFPLWATQAGLPITRPPRRYEAGLTLLATLRGPARLEFMATAGANHVTFGVRGFGWLSDPGINGGVWTPFFRQSDGGFLQLLSASAVQFDATPRTLQFRYEEPGRFYWLIDGATVAELTGGIAFAGGQALYTTRWATSRNVGTTYQWQEPFYKVSEI